MDNTMNHPCDIHCPHPPGTHQPPHQHNNKPHTTPNCPTCKQKTLPQWQETLCNCTDCRNDRRDPQR